MISFFKDWYMRNLSNPAAIILILQFITAFVILYFFSNVFGTLVAALVLAFMLERPVSFLIKHGASRLGATIIADDMLSTTIMATRAPVISYSLYVCL